MASTREDFMSIKSKNFDTCWRYVDHIDIWKSCVEKTKNIDVLSTNVDIIIHPSHHKTELLSHQPNLRRSPRGKQRQQGCDSKEQE